MTTSQPPRRFERPQRDGHDAVARLHNHRIAAAHALDVDLVRGSPLTFVERVHDCVLVARVSQAECVASLVERHRLEVGVPAAVRQTPTLRVVEVDAAVLRVERMRQDVARSIEWEPIAVVAGVKADLELRGGARPGLGESPRNEPSPCVERQPGSRLLRQ